MSLDTKRIVNKPIASNCFIIFDKAKSSKCIIVDPGTKDNAELLDVLTGLSLTPDYIILTHEHFDHCYGVNMLREKYKSIKLLCSGICSNAIQSERVNYSYYFCPPGFRIEAADEVLEELNWKLAWNGYEIHFMQAKGHSSSGIMFIVDNRLFTGDTLIKDWVTVTKSKTGSREDLMDTLKIISSLKGNNMEVYAGHGDRFMLDNYDLSKVIRDKTDRTGL